jgi:hypothetical protein
MRRRSRNPHARQVDPSSLISLADVYATGRDRLIALSQRGQFPAPLDPQGNPKARPPRGRRFASAADAFRRQRQKEESESTTRVDPDLKKLGANDRD